MSRGHAGGGTAAEREIDNPNTMWGEDDPRWDNVWTATTSDDE
jgi:hypothetical protein